jgi:SAM-dependent methyltransferase
MPTTGDDGSAKWGSAFAAATTDGMQAYEDALGGTVFRPWAEYLLEALRVGSGQHLLDVATGPGTVARLASARVGPSGFVLATDFSDSMLAIARAKGDVTAGSRIEYRHSPAVPLDAPSNAFDVVSCQHGFQFFPDRPGALAEMRRALRTGGRVGLAVWAGIDLCPPFAAMRDAIEQVLGVDQAERYAGGPWGLHAPSMLAEMVSSAGFKEVAVEEAQMSVTFEGGATQLEHSLAASGVATAISSLDQDKSAAFARAISEKLSHLTDPSGAVSSYMTSQIVLGMAP